MSSTQLFPQYPGGQSQNKNIYNGLIPIGGIILWSGALASLPDSWKLCDGNNGTIDLRNKFIVCSGDLYNTGATGGSTTVTLNTNEIPAHTHNFTYQIPHQIHNASDVDAGTQRDCWRSNFIASDPSTTEPAGSGGSHENMPPYYALAYIMRIS